MIVLLRITRKGINYGYWNWAFWIRHRGQWCRKNTTR